MRNVSRFRLRAHTLAVKSSIWHGGNGHCDKCSCAAVQNEVHVLFHCQDLFVCSLRRKSSFLFFPFCQSFSMEAPFIPHALSSQTVFDFLSHRHNRLLDTCFFDLPRDVIRSVACFRLRAHTLRIETVTWTHNTSPTCDLCNAHDVQDEQHVLLHCTHPHVVSLRRKRKEKKRLR